MFRSLFTLFLVTIVYGIPTTHGILQNGYWISEQSSKLQTDGNTFLCSEFCYAMWQEGDCISSGQHFWRIHFENEVWLHSVQLTNKEKFGEGFGYGDNNHRRVRPGASLEIFVSFEDGSLKGYFGYNNQSLEQNFDLDSANLFSVCPAIRFYGPGAIRMETENKIPSYTARKELRNFVEMEGRWHVYPENVKFRSEKSLSNTISGSKIFWKHSGKSIATLVIEPTSNSTVGQYKVGLVVINGIVVEIRMYDDMWRSNTSPVLTLIGGPPEIMKFEQQLISLVQSPDSVKIISGNLVLRTDDLVVTFVR